MSDEEPDYEKTQFYLAPKSGAAPPTLPGGKSAHEMLLKPRKDAAPANAAKVDFDITGAAADANPAKTAHVDFDITGAGDTPAVPPPKPSPAPAPAAAVRPA